MRWRKRTGFSGAFPRRERDSLWPSERRELSQGGGCPMAATPQVYRGPRMRNPVTRGLEHQTGNLVPEIMDKGKESEQGTGPPHSEDQQAERLRVEQGSWEEGWQGRPQRHMGAVGLPRRVAARSVWAKPRELLLAQLYLRLSPSRVLGPLPAASGQPALAGGSWRTPLPPSLLPDCCEQLSPGQPLASAEGPVLIKDNYIYSLAV